MTAQPIVAIRAPPRYAGLRRPIRSEIPPNSGLETAQQISMTEQTVAAAFGSRPNRAFRTGAPQRPVKVMIGPERPPCSTRISHEFLKEKTLFSAFRTPAAVALS